MLHYNALLIRRLIFLQTDVNLFFLIRAVMQWDPWLSASKCEVFDRRYGCQHVNVLEFLTVLCTDTALSTGLDPPVPRRLEGTSGKHVQLVSANFKGASKSFSYQKFLKLCLYHVHDVRWRNWEIPGGLTLNVTIISQCSRCASNNPTGAAGDVVDGHGCSVTVLSSLILKASLFVMVVLLRSMWRRLPWTILKLLSTMMIVVVCLHQENDRLLTALTYLTIVLLLSGSLY